MSFRHEVPRSGWTANLRLQNLVSRN